ncbi:MAG: hypothetical protein J6X61_00340, partial [Clostridia bacterium]|nr:hypothetical protein [Clostridia bacterium]
MKSKRLLAFLLAALVLLTAMPVITASAEPNETATQEEPVDVGAQPGETGETAEAADGTLANASLKLSGLGYFDYLAVHEGATTEVADVPIDVLTYEATDGIKTETL